MSTTANDGRAEAGVDAKVMIRRARVSDATAITRLYAAAYHPNDGRDPRECYPFPQFLDPNSVAALVESDDIRWFVAEIDNEIVGTVGAVVNVGSSQDRIAECFGLVVKDELRFRGLGSDLFESLCCSLTEAEDALFVIAETRTANPGGWKVVRRSGFAPLGLEPFAHATPAGRESMLQTGRIPASTLRRRREGLATSLSVQRLSRPLCDGLNCQPYANGADQTTDCRPMHDARVDLAFEETMREPIGLWLNLSQCCSGVIGLHRLEGADNKSQRYRHRYFIARDDERLVGLARTLWDGLDARLRILGLRTSNSEFTAYLIEQITSTLTADTGEKPCSIVIEVRADDVVLQLQLELIGYLPTVYYPALVAEGEDRIDAVQYTYLHGFDIGQAVCPIDFHEWPWAESVVAKVCRDISTNTNGHEG